MVDHLVVVAPLEGRCLDLADPDFESFAVGSDHFADFDLDFDPDLDPADYPFLDQAFWNRNPKRLVSGALHNRAQFLQ